jgi:hypothetical protein
MTLREIVEAAPPGTLFTREGLLLALRKPQLEAERRRRMVGTTTALELIRDAKLDARKLRRLALRWERAQAKGQAVPIRVARKGEAESSDWLYDRGDCMAYRKGSDPTIRVLHPTITPPAGESDDTDRIAQAVLRQHRGR